MRKFIKGKRYDTDTARQVASWNSGHNFSDFRYCTERLYRTARGNWFVHGEGNGASPWSGTYGSMQGPGEGIMPLSEAEAIEWLEERGLTDEIEQYFEGQVQDA